MTLQRDKFIHTNHPNHRDPLEPNRAVRGASRRPLHFSWSLIVLLLSFTFLFAGTHYPSPQGYVTDAANVLDVQTRQTLENQLSAFEQSSSIEIAVATVPSLEGETVEMYANELFSQWKIGKKGKDNGVLLLVAPNERKVRIEVGYGLEAVLPDGLCGDIIREKIIPHFRDQDYSAGIVDGIQAVENSVSSGSHVQTQAGQHFFESPKGQGALFFVFLMPALLIIAFIYAMAWRVFAMGTYWFIAYPLSQFFHVDPLFIRPLMFMTLVMSLFRSGINNKGSRYGPGGFSSFGGFGGFGGGFGGGGGGSFGGFGGGFSGGGGASGGW